MGDFNACRFDFRLDAKNGLMPSKRKKMERSAFQRTNTESGGEWESDVRRNYETLYQCKICSSLFSSRTQLLEHKSSHSPQKFENQQQLGQPSIVSKLSNHPNQLIDVPISVEELSAISECSRYPPIGEISTPDRPIINTGEFDPTSIPVNHVSTENSTAIAAYLSKLNNNILKCLPSNVILQEDAIQSCNSEWNSTIQGTIIKQEPCEDFRMASGTSYSLSNNLESSVLDYSLKYKNTSAFNICGNKPFHTTEAGILNSKDSDLIMDLSCKKNKINRFVSNDSAEFKSDMKQLVYSDEQYSTNVKAMEAGVDALNDLTQNKLIKFHPVLHMESSHDNNELPDKECNPRGQSETSEITSLSRSTFSFQSPSDAATLHFNQRKRSTGKYLSDTVKKLWKNKIETKNELHSSNPPDAFQDYNFLQLQSHRPHNVDPSIFIGELDIPRLLLSAETTSSSVVNHTQNSQDNFCTLKYRSCPVCRQLFSTSKAMWAHVSVHKEYKRSKLLKLKYDQNEIKINHSSSVEIKSSTASDRFCNIGQECAESNEVYYPSATASNEEIKLYENIDRVTDRAAESSRAEDQKPSSGLNLYSCDFPDCEKFFKQQRHLEVHRLIHTGVNQISCPMCRYSCRHSSSMSWHMNTKHGLVRRRLENGNFDHSDCCETIVGNVGQEEKQVTAPVITSGTHSMSALKAKIKTKSINSIIEKYGLSALQGTNLELLNNSSDVLDALNAILASYTKSSRRCSSLNSTAQSLAVESSDSSFLKSTKALQSSIPDKVDHQKTVSLTKTTENIVCSAEKPIKLEVADSPKQSLTSIVCSLCLELFSHTDDLIKHLIYYHSIQMNFPQIKCRICDLLFEAQTDLVEHLSATHGIKLEVKSPIQEFSCYVCGVQYNSREDLVQHFQMHENTNAYQYACPCGFCTSRHNSKSSLKNHIRRIHLVNMLKRSASRYKSELEIERQLGTHFKLNKSHQQLDAFNTPKEYEEQQTGIEKNTHSGLDIHHSADETILMEQNEQKESIWQSYHQQQRNKIEQQQHQQEQQQPSENYKDEHKTQSADQQKVDPRLGSKLNCLRLGCSRRFDSISALLNHLTAHAEERPLTCDFAGCDKTFREMKHLKVHRMQHTDCKPLRCQLCQYSCRQRNSMNWHMKSKHNLEKHVTNDGKTFYA